MERIVVFDVETPNFSNDRICAIGISVIENEEIVSSYHYLVNPECGFDQRNIHIHGITPWDVIKAPAFPEIWETIGPLFRSNLVAAHNAMFDLAVLRKTLQAYGIQEETIRYVDTLAMARAMIKETRNHQLPTLCAWFDIPLDHHNAGSDSAACAEILCRMLGSGANLDYYIKSFSLDQYEPTLTARKSSRRNSNTESLLTLNSILSGITSDNVLAEEDVEFLQKWMDDNASLRGNYPYDKIYSILSATFANGVIGSNDLSEMRLLFKQVADPVNECVCDCEDLDINGKNICLSGEFDCGSRSEVGDKLIAYGATLHERVTQKTDILIVGSKGNSAWSAGNYGNKVKRVLELQNKGIGILLMREQEVISVLEG